MRVTTLKTPALILFFTLLGFGLMFYLQQVDLKAYGFKKISLTTQPQNVDQAKPAVCQTQPAEDSSILDKQARAENACLFIGCGGFF